MIAGDVLKIYEINLIVGAIPCNRPLNEINLIVGAIPCNRPLYEMQKENNGYLQELGV